MHFISRFIRRLSHPDILIGLGLFLLPLAFFWQVTLGNRTLLPADNLYQFQPWSGYRDQLGVPAVPHNALLSDLVLENLPWKQFIRESLSKGEFPLWNPYIFAGMPFLADGQSSALYPFSVIYYVLPLDKAYGWFTVSQLWLAGLFMYLLARGLGIGRFGAISAAVAYQMSSFFIASVVFQMIIAAAVWLPIEILMVEFTVRRRSAFGQPTPIPWIALGAVGLGCEILAGHVEITYYTLLVMGFWAACRLGVLAWQSWRSHSLRASWRQDLLQPAVALLALVILGLGIGAIQFIPTLELASHNFREGSASLSEVRSYAFPPRHGLAFFMPNLFGSPAQHDYYDVFSGQQTLFSWQRADGSSVTDTYWEVGKNYVEGACYVGLLTLLLAAIALLNARFEKAPHARIETAGPYRAILVALSVFSLLFVFGTPAYAILYYGLPGINQLHSPFRWVFPLTLCLAVLAGFGAEALVRMRKDTPHPPTPSPKSGEEEWSEVPLSFTVRLAKWLGYSTLGTGLIVLVGLLLSRVFFERLRAPLETLFHKLAGTDTAFPNLEAFYSVEFRAILLFGLFLVACGCVIRLSRCPIYWPRRFGLGRQPVWMALALVVLTLDLIAASAGFNPAADPQWLAFEPPAITWLKQHDPAQWRFAAIEGQTKVMNANIGWLYGLQDIAGYDSIIPKQYVDYMGGLEKQPQLIYNRIAELPTNPEATYLGPLRALGVKYIVSDTEVDLSRLGPKSAGISDARYSGVQFQEIYRDQAVIIYQSNYFEPLTYTISFDPKMATTPCSPIHTANGPLYSEDDTASRITASGANQVVVDTQNVSNTTSDLASCLVLSGSYFSGWRAYLRPQGAAGDQEKEVPVYLFAGNFRAIQLPPGSWTVRFRYSPPSFQVGAFTTFMAGVVILFLLLLWLWRLFYSEGEGAAVSVRRFAKNSVAPIILNLFNRSIDFAFAAIMLRILGPLDAGIYYYAVVIWGWFDTITNFGLNILLTREVARDRSQAMRYLLNSSVLRLLLAGAGVILLLGFFAVQTAIKPIDPLAISAIVLLYVGLVPNSISYGLTALFYAFEKAEIPAATSTVSAILKAAFGLGALLAGWGVLGLAGVSIILNLITLAILSIQARSLIASTRETLENPPAPAALDRKLIRDMVVASWPLMLNNLLAGLFFKIDVTLLEPMKGSEIVGQYSTAYKWIDALGLIPSLFTMALLPIMSRQAKDDRPALQRSYFFAVKLLVSLALPIAVLTTFAAPTLVGLLGGARYLPDGAIALQIMIWFAPIGWINSLTNYLLIALDQQRAMRWAFAAGVIFNVVTNLLFIPLFSYRAAAVITILSEGVLLISFYILLRRVMGRVPWIALLWKPFAAAGLMAFVLLLEWTIWPNALLLWLVMATGIYLAAMIALRPFTQWEQERLASLLPGPFRRMVAPETVQIAETIA